MATTVPTTINAETAEHAEIFWLCEFSEFCVECRQPIHSPVEWPQRCQRRSTQKPQSTQRSFGSASSASSALNVVSQFIVPLNGHNGAHDDQRRNRRARRDLLALQVQRVLR